MNITLIPPYNTFIASLQIITRSDYSARTPNGNNCCVPAYLSPAAHVRFDPQTFVIRLPEKFLKELIVWDTALFHIMTPFPIKQAEGCSEVIYLTIKWAFDGLIRGMSY